MSTETTRETFALTLDPTTPLADQIRAGNYSYINPGVTADNFALTLPAGKREAVLFEPGGLVSSDEMVGRMKAEGFVPATLDDALALGAQFPERQRQTPIVFLGTTWRGPDGCRRVLVLSGWDEGREVDLCFWYDLDWIGFCRFAAVKAEPAK